MSFDLRFVSRTGKPTVTMNALTKWAEAQPNFIGEKNGENGTLDQPVDTSETAPLHGFLVQSLLGSRQLSVVFGDFDRWRYEVLRAVLLRSR